jgi:hypothetical protein
VLEPGLAREREELDKMSLDDKSRGGPTGRSALRSPVCPQETYPITPQLSPSLQSIINRDLRHAQNRNKFLTGVPLGELGKYLKLL